MKKVKYTFSAYGRSIEIESDSTGSAMGEANKRLIWANPESKDGSWFPNSDSTVWRWVEGDFFS